MESTTQLESAAIPIQSEVEADQQEEETVEQAKKRLKRDLLLCEGFAMPITEQDVEALQSKDMQPLEIKPAGHDFISFLKQ